ncbi:MAG: 1-acyl-sn-glycerol-3-phosphate acyltransferase [Rhodospirillaceae bacterium]|jgi:1-acyl-sn-glycerol-3-phosphate acyltransferase|nr:1-acyl-sn-glycerol-3-phosphate acyltransferase [Rhodospirillaceae bacterium]MBT4046680.1 1-acyl-sn-glycerol-3-phosphate acyltransferase [Rhodospirillaceae bacterium]MBT4691246.1 1-acyl-sn-glycerol-3-phosphate acyltransferase [Rhodospirillaceae bacterium]MBT5082533.1 1-acyl-sn-glycerol-3-phosphate acyltransferase [Rhodospirillaceae bacterium]MBT5525408.1 1-acyl-sn-glycerol-3-phosphate acyltransferase [Rhodospirillaceae bacterium]
MRTFRSNIFNLLFYAWSVAMVVAFSPALLLPFPVIVWGQRQWARGVNFFMRWSAGIKVEYRGLEYRPKGGAIVAAKHQSAWDTLIWHVILDDPAMVMKKELLSIPIYGWMCRKTRMIAVDRKAGTKALRAMLADAKTAADLGRAIVIFPQGTRTAPGAGADDVPYQPGVSALYRGLDVPVVPVALNSGLFWPRRQFLRNPGTIVLQFLEPIPPGLPRKEFDALLRDRIDSATTALELEGQSKI